MKLNWINGCRHLQAQRKDYLHFLPNPMCQVSDIHWNGSKKHRIGGGMYCWTAAAFVPTSKLDLSVHHPDFVSVSFYKIFGYPTGIGCLLVKKIKI